MRRVNGVALSQNQAGETPCRGFLLKESERGNRLHDLTLTRRFQHVTSLRKLKVSIAVSLRRDGGFIKVRFLSIEAGCLYTKWWWTKVQDNIHFGGIYRLLFLPETRSRSALLAMTQSRSL